MNKEELIKKYKVELKDRNPFSENVSHSLMVSRFLDDLNQLDEPQKSVVPQYVADWIDYCKKHNFTLFGCLDPEGGFESLANETFEGDVRKCIRWCRRESDIFARAWLNGYEIEEEKRYTIKVKANGKFLNWGLMNIFYFSKKDKTAFTKDKLKEQGFSWVFDCPAIEIAEVEE